MLIFSIKNEKLGFFNRPIYCESSNEALSYVQNVLMSDADRALRGLKGDLGLYCLGDVDFTTGMIERSKKGPQKVCDLEEIFNTVPEESIPRDSVALHKMIDELAARLAEIEKKGSDPVVNCDSETV